MRRTPRKGAAVDKPQLEVCICIKEQQLSTGYIPETATLSLDLAGAMVERESAEAAQDGDE